MYEPVKYEPIRTMTGSGARAAKEILIVNAKELSDALDRMSDHEFSEFVSNFGGGYHKREMYVTAFVENPSYERKLCLILGIPTEEQKTVQAAVNAASSAELSARAATISVAIAILALVVALISVFR